MIGPKKKAELEAEEQRRYEEGKRKAQEILASLDLTRAKVLMVRDWFEAGR